MLWRVIRMRIVELKGPSGVLDGAGGEIDSPASVSSMRRCQIAARIASTYSKVCAANKSVMWFRELHAFTRAAIR